MLAPDATRAAADLLWQHWQEGRRLAALPPELRPETRADGYAIQAHLEGRSGTPLMGWKIAATSPAGQRHINVDGPMAGRILAERVAPPGARVPLENTLMRVAEPEFAFRLARDLSPRPGEREVEEVMAAVAELHLAIEVPDSRFEDFAAAGAPQLIADNACAHVFVIGPAVTTDWRGIDLAAQAVTARLGDGREVHGRGANVLDDPLLALTWLVNELSRHGVTLAAGQIVSTGTATVPIPVAPGDALVADFGALGEIGVHFA